MVVGVAELCPARNKEKFVWYANSPSCEPRHVGRQGSPLLVEPQEDPPLSHIPTHQKEFRRSWNLGKVALFLKPYPRH